MKYTKLLNYFIRWGKEDFYLKSILDADRYIKDMADKCIPDELKAEIREAREQYLEYIGGEKMAYKHCVGCYENFYNSGDKTCWHFDKNKVLQTKYYIDNNASMGYKNNYRAMKVPPCYRKQGGVLVDKIPMEAK